jgi:hypothetical protein
MASTCFEHYLLIFRRRYANKNWYFGCVLCGTPILVAANKHNTHGKYRLLPPEDEQIVFETCRGR